MPALPARFAGIVPRRLSATVRSSKSPNWQLAPRGPGAAHMCYLGAMSKCVPHPFTINIQARRLMRERFHWAIRQGSQIVREGLITYETFEAARVAGKDVLDQMIAG